MTISPALQRYAGGAHVQVDGWLSQLDADIALQVALEQRRIGLTGSVGEIGIHHGRLFILLALTLQPGETAFAVDIFDDQSANLDASGFGDEAVFRRNMAKFGVAEAQVAVIRSSSTAIAMSFSVISDVWPPTRGSTTAASSSSTTGSTRNSPRYRKAPAAI